MTPFASILKSIWYRLNKCVSPGPPASPPSVSRPFADSPLLPPSHPSPRSFGTEKKTRLSKVYFTWVIRDFGTAEWFHSLLHAIEEQDTERRIEITIYLTAKIKDDDMNNILVQDVGTERDAITSLRSPTNFGRPNWDRTFQGIADQHPDTDCGVFFVRTFIFDRGALG